METIKLKERQFPIFSVENIWSHRMDLQKNSFFHTSGIVIFFYDGSGDNDN